MGALAASSQPLLSFPTAKGLLDGSILLTASARASAPCPAALYASLEDAGPEPELVGCFEPWYVGLSVCCWKAAAAGSCIGVQTCA